MKWLVLAYLISLKNVEESDGIQRDGAAGGKNGCDHAAAGGGTLETVLFYQEAAIVDGAEKTGEGTRFVRLCDDLRVPDERPGF